jgi:phosphoglycolate phosphatase
VLRAVLFDFDLTLADSSAGATECANLALRSLGFDDAPAARIRRTIGLPLPESFRILTGSTDPVLCNHFASRFVQRVDEVMADLTEIYSPVPPLLRALREDGVLIGIVSTKFRYRIHEILRRADLISFITAIVGGEDVAMPKPHPDGILTGLAKLDVASRSAVYVGDHVVDALAAKAAGVDFAGVLTGATDRAAFADHDVDDVLASVGDLREHLLARYPESFR